MSSNRSNNEGGGVANSETHTNRYEPEESENQVEEADLKYRASHVIQLFVPVSLCMAMVVFTVNTIPFYSRNDGQHLFITPFVEETDSIVEKGLMSLGNALCFLLYFVVMTVLYLVFYKFKLYKLIHVWLIVGSFPPLFLLTTIYVQQVLKSLDVPLSALTVLFGLGNFSVLGIMCIYWKGPLRLQQFYLITVSALMALEFIKYSPEWSVWSVLFIMSVWDLFAVLSPIGPLRYLVKTAQKRNASIFPGMIYSSTAMENPRNSRGSRKQPTDTDVCPSTSSSSPDTGFGPAPPTATKCSKEKRVPQKVQVETSTNNQAENVRIEQAPAPQQESYPRHEEHQEERGVKLGLGDFIFYALLIGKASSYFDWITTIACYVAILIGLCLTLVLMAVFERPVPALPISISMGLIFTFCTRWFITPFVTHVSQRGMLY